MSTKVTYNQRVKANIKLVNKATEAMGLDASVNDLGSNLKSVYQALVVNPMKLNEYVRTLSNMIARQVITDISFKSPLRRFVQAKGTPVGSDIQEIYTGLIRAVQYTGHEGAKEAFSNYVNQTLQAFHTPDRDVMYPITISKDRIREAFLSTESLIQFHNEIYQNLYTSAERDEYLYMREVLCRYVLAGNTEVVVVGDIDSKEGKVQFAESVFEYSERLKFINRWNRYKLEMSTPYERQVLILSAKTSARVRAGLTAWAMNKEDLTMPETVVIDSFSDPRITGMLVDERVFKVFDVFNELASQDNAAGRTFNVFYHIKQIISMSAFANAVTFVTEDIPDIEKFIIFDNPLYLQTEEELTYQAYLPEGVTYNSEDGDSVVATVTLEDGYNFASLVGDAVVDKGVITYTLRKGSNVPKGSTFSVNVSAQVNVGEDSTTYEGTQVIQIG